MSIKILNFKYKLVEHNPSILNDDSIFNSLMFIQSIKTDGFQ